MQALKKAEEKQQEAPDGPKGETEPTLRELADELSLEPAVVAAPDGHAEDRSGVRKDASKSGREDFQTAANVFSAKAPPGGGQRRLTPVLIGVAALVLAVGGAYVYVEINHPSLLRNLIKGLTSGSVAVVPQNAPVQTVQSGDAGGAVHMVPADELPQAESGPESALHAARDVAPIKTEAGREPQTEPRFSHKAATSPVSSGQPETGIRIFRAEPGVINPELSKAYEAMQAGRLEAARAHYQRVLQQEPRNLDALLGQAAIEARTGQASEAGRLYLRVLEVEPGNLYAQAGFLGLMGGADPAGSEARLKQLLATQPAAFLYFALGNLYAGHGRWPEAQQAYFQAFHLEPASADHAYNLAVSLDQLNQPRQALDYYKQALMLSRGRGASFDVRALEARISQLQGG
ncbi:MAG: tetratricopeptide repeat protein [Sulfuricellaceae bacterium]|nr:tetratricopeptide repeat protein [Sulfuricellaceae bacterium]